MGNKIHRAVKSNRALMSSDIKSVRYKNKMGQTNNIFFAAGIMDLHEGHLVIVNTKKVVDYFFVHDVDIQKNYDDTTTVVIKLSKCDDRPPEDFVLIEIKGIEDSEDMLLLSRFEYNDTVATEILSVTYS